MRVVFTGQAVDNAGNTILRDNLKAACKAKNITVLGAVNATTDALVASRKDTVKAKAAAARGIAVMTYPEFLTIFLKDTTIPTGGRFNAYTDGSKVDPDSLVPCFLVGPEFTELTKQLDLL